MSNNRPDYLKNPPQVKSITMRFSTANNEEANTYDWVSKFHSKFPFEPRTNLSKLVLQIVSKNEELSNRVGEELQKILGSHAPPEEIEKRKKRIKANIPKQSRTLKTEADYERRAEMLFSSYIELKKVEHADEITADLLDDFVQHILDRRPTLRATTFNQYKASISHWITRIVKPEMKEDPQRIIEKLAAADTQDCKVMTNATSSVKAKTISSDDLHLLLDAVLLSRGRYKELLYHWLVIGSALGLRPVEMLTMKLDTSEGKTKVIIQNAKTTNGRSSGKERVLNITGWKSEYIASVATVIEETAKLKQKGLAETAIWKGLSARMNYITRRTLGVRGKYPTLYTLRHQFRANQAAGKTPKSVIAELMGHKNEKMAETHYGKVKSGDINMNIDMPVEVVSPEQESNQRQGEKNE